MQGCYRSFQQQVFKSLYKLLTGVAIAIVAFEVSHQMTNNVSSFAASLIEFEFLWLHFTELTKKIEMFLLHFILQKKYLIAQVLCLLSSCILMCDVNAVKKMVAKQEQEKLALKTERETILAGMQATGSLAAIAMTGANNDGMLN